MSNPHRGEMEACLNGKSYRLCLTLGALAELEHAFAAQDLPALVQRFETGHLCAQDLIKIIGCGLRGAGENISNDEVAQMRVDKGLQGYLHIVTQLFTHSFGDPIAMETPSPP